MSVHERAFEYLQPTSAQLADMATARVAFSDLAKVLDDLMPDGPDKTYVYRLLRTASMWANIAITRQADGSPRG